MNAELIVINGKVHPHCKAQSYCSAFAVNDGRIVAMGSNEQIKNLKSSHTLIFDAQGKTILPGFIESHAHFLNIGMMKSTLDLSGIKEKKTLLQKVSEAIKKAPQGHCWIQGRGWDQNLWAEGKGELPHYSDLDQIAPDHPVMLTRVDGHAFWLNSRALSLCQINSATSDPEGGKILKDSWGRPTGILIDNALNLVRPYLPKKGYAERAHHFELAMREALSYGITTFHDAQASSLELKLAHDFYYSGRLKIRLNFMIDAFEEDALNYALLEGPSERDFYIRIGTLKLFLDGALGSHGAWLWDDYSDDKGNQGIKVISDDFLKDLISKGKEKGFQLAFHAIGDRAVSHLVQTLLPFLSENDLGRFRLEHGELIREEDIHLIKKLQMIVSQQPMHLLDDKEMLFRHLGEERAIKLTMPWRKLLNSEIPLCFGSDAPIAELNPLWGVWAALKRRQLAESDLALSPEESLNLEEALTCYTLNGAIASREELIKGTLESDKLADFIVLEKDIFSIPLSEIVNLKVDKTFVGGKLVYDSGN